MILGMSLSTFVTVHVIISLIGIAAGIIVMFGLLLLAGCAVIGAAVVVSLRIDARREQSSGAVALAH